MFGETDWDRLAAGLKKGNTTMPHEVYETNDQEFNLARMHVDTIKKAYQRYPLATQPVICFFLGIGERRLRDMMSRYGLKLHDLKNQ